MLSAENVMGQAAELRLAVDRLKNKPDAWRDDALLNRMVELAKVTGDIRENSLVPDKVLFRHRAFWTSHFGGIYVFVDDNTTTVIGDPSVRASGVPGRGRSIIFRSRMPNRFSSFSAQRGVLNCRAPHGSNNPAIWKIAAR